jgi:integrase
MPTKPFIKVRDSNRKPLRGLWQRGSHYYLQVKLRSERSPRRIPLGACSNLSEVKLAAEEARRELREGELPTRGRKPTFAEAADACLAIAATKKKKRTVKEDAYRLRRWKAVFGHVRVDAITTPMIAAWRDKRLLSGAAPRTVNLDLIALRAVFRKCLEDGLIVRNPMAKLARLKERRPLERKFLRPEQLGSLVDEALARSADGKRKYRNGELLADFLKLLAYSGAREQEALALRWSDVDFGREQLTIGADGDTKNSRVRRVDFNDALGRHLRDMSGRRDPETAALFPSPLRGDRDQKARSLRETLCLVRTAVGLDNFMPPAASVQRLQSRAGVGFHDMRHHFASMCVMSGVPFRQIADWLGHRDGGILVGKVYGHLDPDFGQRAARKVSFSTAQRG